MPIHDLNYVPKLKHRHAILLIFRHAQVNTDQLLAISDSTPAYRGKLGD
jgi:hypothetical protein